MGVSSFFKDLFGESDKVLDSLVNQAEDLAESTKVKISEYVPGASDALVNKINTLKEKASEAIEQASDLAENAVEDVKGKLNVLSDTPTTPKV